MVVKASWLGSFGFVMESPPNLPRAFVLMYAVRKGSLVPPASCPHPCPAGAGTSPGARLRAEP